MAYDPQSATLSASKDGDEQPLPELTDEEQQQVVLSVQLSAASELASAGIRLPIVLGGHGLTNVEDRSQRMAAQLCQIAAQGQQILLATAYPTVAATIS